ncbi:DUF4302 domain-containing protein [Pedobacter frigidisoli]|uniref:DUF4302 domain-containing protein n=1 Tax=Pedobacter frigidisoli TaxID=2530455 RepID=UPI00292D1442|nr:DUF4302 domain-containing protein [Pedobacter frigidisoli]
MKKILYLFIFLLSMAGCKNSSFESAFDELPEARMQAAIAKVNTTLTSAQNGWIATLPTQAGGGYGFFVTFDGATQVVKMYSDLTGASSTTVGVSTYRVKANAGAELIFDTYNSISLLDDPDPASFAGVTGSGHKSDVEFIYDHSTADSIIFTGKKYRQPFKLVKATAAQKAAYESGGYKTAIDKFKSFFATTSNPYIEIVSGSTTLKGGINFDFTTSVASGKRVNFTGLLADGTVGSGSSKFAFKLDGVDFLGSGLAYSGVTFLKALWKDATTLVFYDVAGKEYIVKSNPTPLLPLYILIGSGYKSVIVPNATTFPGWGSDFITRRAAATTGLARWNIGAGSLRFQSMTFTFNDVTKKMSIKIDAPDGTNSFSLTFDYTYTKTADGVFKFNQGTLGGNESAIGPDLAPLLGQRINVDTFTVDYFTHPTTGVVMALFKSVQNPTFTFTGNIQ